MCAGSELVYSSAAIRRFSCTVTASPVEIRMTTCSIASGFLSAVDSSARGFAKNSIDRLKQLF